MLQESLYTSAAARHQSTAADCEAFSMQPAITHRPSDGYSLTAASRSLCRGNVVQKILLSATLTHDPEELAALRLVHPRLFSASLTSAVSATGARIHPPPLPPLPPLPLSSFSPFPLWWHHHDGLNKA